jgi:hypothetical protein
MIPIGEKCKECGRIHVVKSMKEYEELSPQTKTKAYKSEHRIFKLGYYTSLDVNDETWEIYQPLSTLTIEIQEESEPEPEEKTTTEKLIEEYYEVEEEED